MIHPKLLKNIYCWDWKWSEQEKPFLFFVLFKFVTISLHLFCNMKRSKKVFFLILSSLLLAILLFFVKIGTMWKKRETEARQRELWFENDAVPKLHHQHHLLLTMPNSGKRFFDNCLTNYFIESVSVWLTKFNGMVASLRSLWSLVRRPTIKIKNYISSKEGQYMYNGGRESQANESARKSQGRLHQGGCS